MSHPATIGERAASAANRWAAGVARQSSGRVRITGSQWLIASSRATLARRRPAIRGGAGDDERIQEHLRSLIARGMLPATMPRRLFVGKCLEAHLCTACEQMIEVGDSELEWTNPADLIMYFHRQCVEIYRALPDGHESR